MVNKINFNRFFAFGCSFTQHLWPTWADIVARDLELPYQNWGKTGAGNVAIQSRIVECDFQNNLTEDDLVIVMWSGWNREDRYINNKWLCGGNVFNNWNYDETFLEKYWSLENDYIKSTTAIHTTWKAYKDIIRYHAAITVPTESTEFKLEDHFKLLRPDSLNSSYRILDQFYKNSVTLNVFDSSSNTFFNYTCSDGHPDIMTHLKFVTDQLYPSLGFEIKESTVRFCQDYFDEAARRLKKTDTYDVVTEKIVGFNKEIGFDQQFWGI